MSNQTCGDCQSTEHIASFAGFDALRILEDEITITNGEQNYTFETLRDADGRITSVNCDGKNREVTYV